MLFSYFLFWAFNFMSFLFCSLEPIISFWRYLIINLNHKKNFNVTWTIWLLSLALWSDGLLGFKIRDLDLPWDLVTSTIILSGALGVYLKTLGCLFVFVCRFLRLHPLFVIWNSPAYSCYSAQFLWRLNVIEAWFS